MLSGRKLVVQVNSAKRAQTVKKKIDKRLGPLAVLQERVTTTAEQLLEERKQRSPAADVEPGSPRQQVELPKEVQAAMQQEMQSWVYKKLPILGGRTPMEAVADPDGREIVESLLLDWERRDRQPPFPGQIRIDVAAIRRQLNL